MPHQLVINHDLKIVHLTYHGEVHVDERKSARDKVFQACEGYCLSRVLVDMRDSNIRMSEKDIVHFAMYFQRARLLKGYRLACIVAQHNQTEYLLETIITLEGINAKYFLSFDDGLNWLTAV